MENLKSNGPPSEEGGSLNINDVFRVEDDNPQGSQFSGDPETFNELNVLKSIHQTLETNSDIVSLVPGFFEAREVFKSYIKKLTGRHSELKDNLIKTYLKIADALRNYGVMTENAEIIVSSNVKDSYFKHSNDSELVQHSYRLYNNAKLYITTLIYFGISFETLKDFETNINRFSYAAGLHSGNVFEKSDWRDDYDREFDEAYSFVHNTLDNFLEGIKERFPKFYAEYISAKTQLNIKEHS